MSCDTIRVNSQQTTTCNNNNNNNNPNNTKHTENKPLCNQNVTQKTNKKRIKQKKTKKLQNNSDTRKRRKIITCGNDSSIKIDISHLQYPQDFKYVIAKRTLRKSWKPKFRKDNLNNNGKWKCDICSQRFNKYNQLLNHKRNHKNFTCPIPECNATKARQSAYQDHMDRHFNYKRHQCKKCCRYFFQSALRTHKCKS